jgi:hypothetical protein
MKELLQFVIATIHAAEAVYPEGKRGSDKLALVVAAVDAYAPIAGVAADMIDRLTPYVRDTFVPAVVHGLNRLGTFTHK